MSRMDSLGIAPQTDWGEPAETIEFYIPTESVDVNHNNETIEVEETTGTRFPARIERGTRFGELTISGPVRSESFGRILYGTFGEPATTGAGAAKTHVFDPAAEGKVPLPISLLVAREDPKPNPIVDLFYDAIVNELTISAEPNGYLSYQASVVSRDYNEDTSPTTDYDFSERFPFHKLTAYITIEGGGGEEEIPLASWSVAYSNNVPTDVFILGQRTLWEVVEDNASCEVTFSPRSKMAEHHRRALADNPESVRLRVEAVGSDIGSGSVPDGEFRLEVDVACLEYTDAPASINAGERMRQIDITARAAIDEDTGKFVTVTLENTTTGYDQPEGS